MKDKKIASVRPSPFASIAGIIGLIVMLIFGISNMSGTEAGGGFMLIWVLFAIGGIIYFVINLSTYSKSSKEKIPLTSDEVIEIAPEGDEEEGKDFEARLRKLESLRKDGLVSEEEYIQKRKQIMEEKW